MLSVIVPNVIMISLVILSFLAPPGVIFVGDHLIRCSTQVGSRIIVGPTITLYATIRHLQKD